MSTFAQFFTGGQAQVDPSNVNISITGGILGLLYYKSGPNEMTVTAGACKDRTGLLDIQVPNDVQVAIPATPDIYHHLFACTDGTIKVDADITGATIRGADPNLGIRWIGFVLNDSTGELFEQRLGSDSETNQLGPVFLSNCSAPAWSSGASSGVANFSLSPFIPPDIKIKSVAFSCPRVGEAAGGVLGEQSTMTYLDVKKGTSGFFEKIDAEFDFRAMGNNGTARTIKFYLIGVKIIR